MPEVPAFEHVSLTPSVAGRRVSQLRSDADLIWGVAELLRGDYKPADYGKVIAAVGTHAASRPSA